MLIKLPATSIVFLFLIMANLSHAQQNPIPKDASYYQAKGFQTFAEFNFAIKCPCSLSDVSHRSPGDNDLSYGCVMNENSDAKLIMYQILVKKIPAGYQDATPEKKKEVEEKLFSTFGGNKKIVSFNNVNAVIVSYSNKGITGKAMAFIKNGATFTFNLMTNDGLEEKFNSLTNNIKFF